MKATEDLHQDKKSQQKPEMARAKPESAETG